MTRGEKLEVAFCIISIAKMTDKPYKDVLNGLYGCKVITSKETNEIFDLILEI